MNNYQAIKDIKERQLTFLKDTAAHYNLSNRGVRESVKGAGSICTYVAGCAIGRHITDMKKREDFDASHRSAVGEKEIFNRLPKWMKEMGDDFLGDVQALHDEESNWDGDGINEKGKNAVENIEFHFELKGK